MPELPEVEITRRGIEPHLKGRTITGVEVREPRLRWRVPVEVSALAGCTIVSVKRRGKYLLVDCGRGHLILHLGMSGSLRIVQHGTRAEKHDHFDLALGAEILRLRDPRRFGAVLWTVDDPHAHRLLASLGVEPLSAAFNAGKLHALSRGHRVAIKLFLGGQHLRQRKPFSRRHPPARQSGTPFDGAHREARIGCESYP